MSKTYAIGEWTESEGRTKTAQSDKGISGVEKYAGVYVGSGKLMLSMDTISEREFLYNKKKGIITI